MGQYGKKAEYFNPDGSINVKAELDAYYHNGYNEGHVEIAASEVVDGVYYAAIKWLDFDELIRLDDDGEPLVNVVKWHPIKNPKTKGVVILPKICPGEEYDFCFKVIPEELGPYYYDCPEYILDLLSPLYPPFSRADGSGDEAAWEWRQTCRAVAQAKKKKEETKG